MSIFENHHTPPAWDTPTGFDLTNDHPAQHDPPVQHDDGWINPASKPRFNRVEIGTVSTLTTITLAALLLVGGAGDFVNASSVFDLVFTGSGAYIGWILAISVTVLALLATHGVGYLWRAAGERNTLRAVAATVLTAWLTVGATLAVLRLKAGTNPLTATATTNPLAGISNTPTGHPHAVTALLAALWVLTGLVSLATGLVGHNPAGAALNHLESTNNKQDRRLALARYNHTLSGHTLTAKQNDLTRLREAYRQAEQGINAHTAELLAWARHETTRLLADPAATSDILPRPDQTNPTPNPTPTQN